MMEDERLTTENPNIKPQIRLWRVQRVERGEDPDNWQEFREHVQRLGAPDPGEEAPVYFTDVERG